MNYSACFRYSCDLMVVWLVHERNSSTTCKLQKQILEHHSKVHMQRVLWFLQAREPFHLQVLRDMFSIQRPEVPLLELVPVPKAPWFLAVYVRDVMSRLDELNARITSTFGSILKLDSTKRFLTLNSTYTLNILIIIVIMPKRQQ